MKSALEQKICVVCGMVYDSGTILRPLTDNMITGWGMCDEDQQKFDSGFIALIGCDPEKSAFNPDGTIAPDAAYRTGRVAHLKEGAFNKIFNQVPPNKGFVFCPDEVIDMLEGFRDDQEVEKNANQ